MEELLNKLIDLRFRQNEKFIITMGKVTQVRECDCDVEREQMPDILGVRYHAIVGDLSNFFRIVPKQGSNILCGIIENDLSEAVVLAYSEIEKVIISLSGAELVIENGKFTISNQNADLKDILKTGFETLKNATITTPSGPGQFSPNDKLIFETQKNKVIQLFN